MACNCGESLERPHDVKISEAVLSEVQIMRNGTSHRVPERDNDLCVGNCRRDPIQNAVSEEICRCNLDHEVTGVISGKLLEVPVQSLVEMLIEKEGLLHLMRQAETVDAAQDLVDPRGSRLSGTNKKEPPRFLPDITKPILLKRQIFSFTVVVHLVHSSC